MIDKQTNLFPIWKSAKHRLNSNQQELSKHSEVIPVGISSHHSFVAISLKSQPVNGNAKTKTYRDCGKFNMDALKQDVDEKLRKKCLGSTIIVPWQRHWKRQ